VPNINLDYPLARLWSAAALARSGLLELAE